MAKKTYLSPESVCNLWFLGRTQLFSPFFLVPCEITIIVMLPHGQKYKSITFRTDTSNPPSSWTVCRRWCCCGSFGLTSGYRNQLFLCLHICIYTVQCSSLCISHVQEGEHRQISSDSALVTGNYTWTSWFLKFLLNFEEGWGDQAGQKIEVWNLKCWSVFWNC